MQNLNEMTLSLVAARNAYDDAKVRYDEAKEAGGQTMATAREEMDVARMNYEHFVRQFRETLDELKSESLLQLSIEQLDRETLMAFRRQVAQLGLDDYTEPVAYGAFDSLAQTWSHARRFLTATRELESRSQQDESDEFTRQLDALDPDQLGKEYADVLKGWQHLRRLGLDAASEAVSKLLRYARAQVDEITSALAGKIARMQPRELHGAMLGLDADLRLELQRAMDTGEVPCPKYLQFDPQAEPEAQPSKRVQVATMVAEDQETAEEVGLSPEDEAMVDELLRDAFGDQ
jgi:hypothetical protein